MTRRTRGLRRHPVGQGGRRQNGNGRTDYEGSKGRSEASRTRWAKGGHGSGFRASAVSPPHCNRPCRTARQARRRSQRAADSRGPRPARRSIGRSRAPGSDPGGEARGPGCAEPEGLLPVRALELRSACDRENSAHRRFLRACAPRRSPYLAPTTPVLETGDPASAKPPASRIFPTERPAVEIGLRSGPSLVSVVSGGSQRAGARV